MAGSRSILNVVLAAALLGAGAEHVVAQDALWQRVRAAYDAPSTARIEAVVEGAVRASVPAEPLLAKALEGAAKGVPADRVLPALVDYAARLEQARGLMPGPASAAGLVAGADALRRGVPPEAIREMAQGPPESMPAALLVLGDLVEAGVPVEQARQAVQEALAMGHGPERILDLPAVVRRRIREGQPPGEAARGAPASMGPPGGAPPGLGRGGGPPGGAPPGKPPVPPGSQGGKPGGKPGGGLF